MNVVKPMMKWWVRMPAVKAGIPLMKKVLQTHLAHPIEKASEREGPHSLATLKSCSVMGNNGN